ncbi:MAG: hypothetical protein V8S74_06505 [Lachnospirales bacterium]
MPDYSRWKEIEVPLSQILLDTLNPRVIIKGDVTQEKIIDYLIKYFDVINLANAINDSNGLPPADKIVCIKEDEHYIVVEGNRRIAACKILSNANNNPDTYKGKLKKINKDALKYIKKIKICLAPSRDEAEPYITLRHSDYGIKKWSTLAQVQRVMQRYNLGLTTNQISKILELKKGEVEKSIKFYNFLEYVKNNLNWTKEELEVISDPLLETTKLDRFLPFSSKAKNMLHIDFDKNYNLMIGIDIQSANKALKKIISNIFIENIYNTRAKLEDVFNEDIARICKESNNNINLIKIEYKENNSSSVNGLKDNTKSVTSAIKNIEIKENIKTNNNDIGSTHYDKEYLNKGSVVAGNNSLEKINEKNFDDNNQKEKKKRNPKPANFFDNFKWTKLNKEDSYENGIISLCTELKELSKTKDYKKYPVATAVIMRSILENSLIYYAEKSEKKSILNKIKRKDQKGYKNLDDILRAYTNDAQQGTKDESSIFYNKESLCRFFLAFASSSGTRAHLNMIIHRPGDIIAHYAALESIADSGFKAFLEEILN